MWFVYGEEPEAELRDVGSQAELGNQHKSVSLVPKLRLGMRYGKLQLP